MKDMLGPPTLDRMRRILDANQESVRYHDDDYVQYLWRSIVGPAGDHYVSYALKARD